MEIIKLIVKHLVGDDFYYWSYYFPSKMMIAVGKLTDGGCTIVKKSRLGLSCVHTPSVQVNLQPTTDSVAQ